MAFSEYNVFNVSVQLKLEALDFSFPECGDSVFGIFRADTSELGVACVGSAYLAEVIKFVPQDMQKESSGLTGASHAGQDFLSSSSFLLILLLSRRYSSSSLVARRHKRIKLIES